MTILFTYAPPTIPALDPMSVPLPPKFAPKDSAHQSGLTAKSPYREAIWGLELSVSINGIIVAVNGMLSTKALEIAESHTIIRNVIQGLPPVMLIAPLRGCLSYRLARQFQQL